MNILQKLSSRNLLVFNLVLIGVVFGFSLAFVSFSCSTPTGTRFTARAQENPVAINENALAIAEGLQNAVNVVADRVLPSVVELKTISVRRQNVPGNTFLAHEANAVPKDGDRNGNTAPRDWAPES